MKKQIEITLNLKDYLDKAFKTIPANANIHKGRCGIGGTTLEIKAERCSILTAPTKGIITDKCNSHSELFPVQGKVTVKQIAEYLASDVKYKKIITTPDSFGNIIAAAMSIGKLNELYEYYFLLMDESHSAITEAFRDKMLIPFKYFWNFKNKSLISATPFEFSDERFQSLTPYQIKFHEPRIGKVTVRNTTNVEDCVDWYIKNRDTIDGKLFFFYNSVTEIAEAIRRNDLNGNDVHIYCADKEENFEKLPDNLIAFQQQPETGKYADVNFFTSKYFEGFDLKEKDATIILVTDVHKAHTKVGITNKGVQAVGRVRFLPKQIIHITNNRNKTGMKTLSQFRKEYEIHTDKLITSYNSYIADCNEANIEPIENPARLIERFVEIDNVTKLATLHETKLDQVLNELACNEQFNNKDTIVQAWEQSLYEVQQQPFIETAVIKKRMSKAFKLKALIDLIDTLKQNKDQYVLGAATKELAKLQQENPFAFEAYLLGKERLAELNYNEKAVKEALIKLHNEHVESKLLVYLNTRLVLDGRYPIEQLVNILQYGYNLFQIREPKTGKIRVAYATQLGEAGRYKIDGCKIDVNGKSVNGYIISVKYFNIPMAA